MMKNKMNVLWGRGLLKVLWYNEILSSLISTFLQNCYRYHIIDCRNIAAKNGLITTPDSNFDFFTVVVTYTVTVKMY